MVLLALYNVGNIDWISYIEQLILIGDAVLLAGYFCGIATSLASWDIVHLLRNWLIILGLPCKICWRGLSSGRAILLYNERTCCAGLSSDLWQPCFSVRSEIRQ